MIKRYEKSYLGDGVYVHHDGYQIWLTAPRETEEHQIALEPEVLHNFMGWLANFQNPIDPNLSPGGWSTK
jgi:hypothetical protein